MTAVVCLKTNSVNFLWEGCWWAILLTWLAGFCSFILSLGFSTLCICSREHYMRKEMGWKWSRRRIFDRKNIIMDTMWGGLVHWGEWKWNFMTVSRIQNFYYYSSGFWMLIDERIFLSLYIYNIQQQKERWYGPLVWYSRWYWKCWCRMSCRHHVLKLTPFVTVLCICDT